MESLSSQCDEGSASKKLKNLFKINYFSFLPNSYFDAALLSALRQTVFFFLCILVLLLYLFRKVLRIFVQYKYDKSTNAIINKSVLSLSHKRKFFNKNRKLNERNTQMNLYQQKNDSNEINRTTFVKNHSRQKTTPDDFQRMVLMASDNEEVEHDRKILQKAISTAIKQVGSKSEL